MTTITIAGCAGRIAGTAARHLIALERQIDWREVAAIVWHGLITLAVMTYVAGQLTGAALHRLNNAAAGLWRQLLVPQGPAHQPRQPFVHPLALQADALQQLTRRELNAITGNHRRTAKAQLVAIYLAA